jgi:hypothetical protein
MPQLEPGDKCPRCKDGLLERTEIGLDCDTCSFEMEIAEVVEANRRDEVEAGDYRFRPASVRIRIETPEGGEDFLRGLIVARANNSSPIFVDLIDGINALLEDYRAAKLREELSSRAAAGMA